MEKQVCVISGTDFLGTNEKQDLIEEIRGWIAELHRFQSEIAGTDEAYKYVVGRRGLYMHRVEGGNILKPGRLEDATLFDHATAKGFVDKMIANNPGSLMHGTEPVVRMLYHAVCIEVGDLYKQLRILKQ